MLSYNEHTTGADVVDRFKDRVANKASTHSSILTQHPKTMNTDILTSIHLVVITGASANGLGAHTALALARGHPKQIFLLGRSATKVQPVLDEIKTISPSTHTYFVPVELDKLGSVRAAVSTIAAHAYAVDLLINNAGIMAVEYGTNPQGVEAHLATNHLGHFVLTKGLMPLLVRAAEGGGNATRVVNLTSDGYTICPFQFESPDFDGGKTYDRWAGYGQSKTANILFTVGLEKRFRSAGVGIGTFAVHPGVITTTSLSNHLDPKEFGNLDAAAMKWSGQHFQMGTFKEPGQGVATTVVACLDPSIGEGSGSYMQDCEVRTDTREYATSEENAERLWRMSEGWVGEKFDI